MKRKHYLAIDIGASSGRLIVGYESETGVFLDEVYRFKNEIDISNGELTWNVDRLFAEIVEGIRLSLLRYGEIESLAIDTWGVDYALIDGDKPISPVYAYRSDRTKEAIEMVHKIIPLERLYELTGEQYQHFNTVYQLYADKMSGRLERATDFLMIPEYFNYLLTGKKVKEYTNATTGAFVNAETGEYDKEIIEKLALPERLFTKLHYAGEEVGDLLPKIQKKVGGNIKVRLCASHDTACAFEAVDTKDSIMISSGTWSLVGLRLKKADTSKGSFERNFANEGGVGYFRYLKNVMGMWIVNQCCFSLGVSVYDLEEMARKSTYARTFDVNDASLIAPESMPEAIEKLLGEKLSKEDLFSSVFNSLALSYKNVINEIEENLGRKIDEIYIVGGGAKNEYLNQLTQKYCNKSVVAMPIEATAIGNIKTQMRGN